MQEFSPGTAIEFPVGTFASEIQIVTNPVDSGAPVELQLEVTACYHVEIILDQSRSTTPKTTPGFYLPSTTGPITGTTQPPHTEPPQSKIILIHRIEIDDLYILKKNSLILKCPI